MTSPYFY